MRASDFNCRVTRRGELILDDGRKLVGRFGRPWKPNVGPTRQIVRADIDGRRFSGTVCGSDRVRLIATEA